MRTLFFLIIIMIAFSCQNNKKENIAIEKNNEIHSYPKVFIKLQVRFAIAYKQVNITKLC